jgi:peptide/nickel transport system ATP-binding protein
MPNPAPKTTPKTTPPSPPKIEYRNVYKDFPVKGNKGKLFSQASLHAVSNVSFSIEEGCTLALVGESGCGKTTMARLLMKLHEPSSGSILVDGKDIAEERGKEALRAFRSKIQMIFQDPFGSLNPAHTAGEIIGRAITLHARQGKSGGAREKTLNLLELVGLTPAEDFIDKHPAQLSGGQRQRIVIARALAVNPSIIVADEPTSMLDVSIGIDIMNLLIELKEKQRLTMMYITHNLASARYMADHMAVMYAGACVEYGSIDAMIEQPYHPYTVLLLNSTPEPFRDEEILIAAKEENPDLISGKPQCMFCARCPLAQERCFNTEPPEMIYGDRRVKCFLYEGKEELSQPLCNAAIYAIQEVSPV